MKTSILAAAAVLALTSASPALAGDSYSCVIDGITLHYAQDNLNPWSYHVTVNGNPTGATAALAASKDPNGNWMSYLIGVGKGGRDPSVVLITADMSAISFLANLDTGYGRCVYNKGN
jgi:hypothetical protein